MKSFPTLVSISKRAAFFMLFLGFCLNATAQESKIGYVDTERIFREANFEKMVQAKIDQEFSKRVKEIQGLGTRLKMLSEKFDKDGPALSESERIKRQRELIDLDKDAQRKERELREDLNQRNNEEKAIFLERVNKVIRQIAVAEKFDLIFQDAVYFNPRIDISAKVLEALNK